MGSVVAMTQCPYHDDNSPSLAIYPDGYYCFGCKKSGKLEPWMTDLVTKEDSRPKYRTEINRDKFNIKYNDRVHQFFEERGISIKLAQLYGITANERQLCIPAYDFDGSIHGYQIRNLGSGPKYKSIPYKDKYARYSWVDLAVTEMPITGVPVCVIVESVVDALCVAKLGLPSMALLGTNIPTEIIPFFNDYKVLVLFDPDATVISSYLQDVIGAYGIDTRSVPLIKKPYEIDPIHLYKGLLEAAK
jgi:DNA primase